VSYEGPEYWYVIYKAVADFGDLMRDAAQARAALQGMADAVKAEAAAEVAGATQAAQARKSDITAIQQESVALSQLAAAAKSTNVQLLYGGRNDMQQHLADMASQLQYQTLLNRQQWLGFSTVQQAMAYRQQMYQQALLENKASFAGYLTADQYLAYLQKRTSATSMEAVAIKARAAAVADETAAMLAYDNAVQGTHQSIGQLGEGISSAAAYASALTGLPDAVVTHAEFDASRAIAQVAAYRAMLTGLPRAESVDIISAATRLGGIPLSAERVPVTVTPELSQAELSAMMRSYQPALTPSSESLSATDESALADLLNQVRRFGESEAAAQAAPGRQTYTNQEWAQLVDRVGAFYDALESADAEALQSAGDFAPNPADAAAWEQLAFEIGGVGAAANAAAAADGWQQLALDTEYFAEPRIMTVEFDDSEASKEVERYQFLLDELPEVEVVEAELVDDEAEQTLHSFVGDLMSAVRDRYAFYAELDDQEALSSLNVFMQALRDAAGAEERLFAGAGGRSGGGGGGAPPGGVPGAADFEPDPEDADSWDALADAERNAGMSAEEAIAHLIALAQAAAAAGDAAAASRYAWSANVFQSTWVKAEGTAAEETVLQFLRLAQAANTAADAAKYANAAQQLMAGNLFTTRNEAFDAGQALVLAAEAADKAGQAAETAGGRWGFLTKQVGLWSGLFGSTELIGQVQMWHILMDGIIEVLALWVPAVTTAVVALVGGGIASYQSWKAVYEQFKDLTEVSDALGQKIPPLTSNFSNLEASVRPQVFELLGDYLDAASDKTGTFGSLINATGEYLDRFAAKIVVDMQSGGHGLSDFFATGEKDLALIGQGFDSLGQIFGKLIQATAITHIAEDLAAVGDAILKVVADIFRITPTPVLVFLLAAHGIILWGGLAADAVGKVVIAIAGLTSRFQLLNSASMAVAQFFNATDAKLISIAANSAAVENVMRVMGDSATAEGVANLALQIDKTGVGLSQFVEAAGPASAARLAQFSVGLSDAERDTVALGIAAGATDDQLARLVQGMSGTAEESGEAAGSAGLLGGAFSVLTKIPVVGWIALVAAALTGLGIWLGLRADQTQVYIESLDSAISKSTALTVVSSTVTSLASVTNALNLAQQTGVGNATELANAHADLTSKLTEELTHVGSLSSAYGVSFVGALNLLNAAGVKTSSIYSDQAKVWAEAQQQVKGLVSGYQAMGQQIGAVGEDLNALNVEQSTQLKDMGDLNTAYDDWTKIVGAAPSAFITMAQGFSQFWSDAQAAGASMTGLSSASLTLQSDFQSNYNNVEQFFDAFRDDQALTGTGNFVQFVKDAVASLIPMAGGSKEAAAQISALAQEAGGPATDNIEELQRWVGSIYDPLRKMYDASNSAAIGASNLSQDAARLTNTLQSDLDPAMANAIFNAHGGQQVFQDFATALVKTGPSSKATVEAARNVAAELIAVMGNSASAKGEFVGFAEAMGLNSKQADKLWGEASSHISGNLKSVRDSLAKTASATAELAKPGLWGQIEHVFMAAFDGVSDWFTKSLPHALELSYDDVAAFFTSSVPHAAATVASFFAGPFATDVEGAWAHVWSALADPVEHAFDDVKRAITTGFDQWWAHHGVAVEDVGHALWTALNQIFTSGGHLLTGDAATFWSGLTSLWRSGASAVTGTAIELWHDLTGLAVAFWQVFGPLVKSGWDIVVGIFRLAITVVEAVSKALWDGLTTLAKVFWDGLETLVKLAWDTIVAIFSVALDLITGHWAQAWSDIKNYGTQVWNAISEFFLSAWADFRQDFTEMLSDIKSFWTQTWGDIESAGVQVWHALDSGFQTVVGSIRSSWSSLEGIFKAPVSFLVNDVYDQGIARLWNDVMGAIGGPKLPILKFQSGGLAEDGGRLTGFGGGDIVPALLEPGEAVVSKETTARYAWLLKLMGVPGFQAGGLIGDLTSFFGGVGHDIVHLLGDALDVGKIVTALLSGNTTALANALGKFTGAGGATAELAQMIEGIPRAFIHQLLSEARGLGAEAFGSGGSATAGVETVARYIMSHGGTKEAGAGVGGVVSGESGGSPEVLEAGGGGGAGLLQWTPASSAGPIQPIITGNVGRDMAVQLIDMMAYIDSRGGISAINAGGAAGGPMGAAEVFSAMEAPRVPGSDIRPGVVSQLFSQGLALGGLVRMASGGSVINAIRAVTGNRELRESMALASYLATGWNAGYDKSGLYGAWAQPAGRNATKGDWQNPSWAARALLGAFAKGVSRAGATEWDKDPERAAEAAAGYVESRDYSAAKSGGAVNLAWQLVLDALGYARPVTPAPKARVTPKGMDAAQAWSYYASLLPQLNLSQTSSFWALNSARLPVGRHKATPAQWAGWYADLLVMQAQQDKVARAWQGLSSRLADPASMTADDWSTYLADLGVMKDWEQGATPPRSAWGAERGHRWPKGFKPGDVKPSAWAGWKYENALWSRANAATASTLADARNAYAAWKSVFGVGGPSSMYTTPGTLVTPEGGGSYPVNLASLIVGGPADPAQVTGPSRSSTGAGFAGGGLVGDMASLFALSVPALPSMASGVMSQALQRQLTGVTGQPRTVAQAAGDRIGVQVGNLTIHNPLPEKPSDSIARSSNRVAFLAGRGAV
jgi:hypothetical protein